MSKSLIDYPVTFPYGATEPPYSTSRPHRGSDRAAPCGTQVFRGEDRILVGTTGLSTGCHTHTQAGTDEWCQNHINPKKHEFKAGYVKHVGRASQWGKYVIIQTGNRFVCYAHLSKNDVAKGEYISDMYKGKTAKYWYNQYVKQKARAGFFKAARERAVNALKSIQEILDKFFFRSK